MRRDTVVSGARMLVLLTSVALGCGSVGNSQVDAKDSQTAWQVLFDGSGTSAWRGFRRTDLPSGWQAVDGALTRVSGGGDIVTRDEFGDFELELEWKLQPRGNSGIMFRVSEGDSNTYRTGPEMQVLDDAGHRDGQDRLTAAGSNYALHAASAGVVRPVGEWNQVRLVVRGPHVEHWLNGQKVVEYELWSPDWEARVKASKFAAWPGYGRARRGHIALQDHGDWVAYRNIRIRALS
jgi:3-keto-disaccharide hydrolase